MNFAFPLLLAKEDLEWRFDTAQPPWVVFLVVVGVIAFVVLKLWRGRIVDA